MSHRSFALLLAFCLLPSITQASESLSLEQAVQEARSRSPEFLRIQAVADEASAREFEALSGYLPRLTIAASHLVAHKFLLFQINGGAFEAPNPISVVTFDFGINLFDGFQTTNSYRAARLSADAARLESDHAVLQLSDSVRLSFFQALAAQQLAEVSDQNVKTLKDHLAKTKALLSGGATTKLDTLRVEVQLSEALPDQIQAHDTVVIARKALAQTMGLDEDNRPLTGNLPEPNTAQLPTDLKLDVSKRPDLVAFQERADAASKAHLASYSGWIPHVNFLAEYQPYNNLNDSLSPDSFLSAYSVGIGLSWTIFDGANLARVRQAAAQQTEAEKSAEIVLQRAPVEFETWKRRFLSNVSLYHARTQAIESATESVRLAHLSYEAGTRTSTEVLDAELDLFRARAGVVRAQVDSAEALIKLELAVGHSL